MNTKAKQHGMSMITMLVIAVIVIIIGMMVLRLFPVYYGAFKVSHAFDTVKKQVHAQSAHDIRRALERRFNINEIDKIPIKNVEIKPAKEGGFDVSLKYERRVPFLGNLSMVATFDNHMVIRGADR